MSNPTSISCRHALAGAALLAATSLSLQAQGRTACAADNAGLTLPAGFCVQIVAENVGAARHIAVLPNGDLAVAIRNPNGGVVILRDTNGDGVSDRQQKFGIGGGTGIAFFDGHLYFSTDSAIVRWRWPAGAMEPAGPPDTVAYGLHTERSHSAKAFTIGRDGSLYVNIGAPSNSCQVKERENESPGINPCPLLAYSGGIWRFDARKTKQTQRDGTRWVTGIRNIVAIGMDPAGATAWAVQHGRDLLSGNWGKRYPVYTDAKSAENPAEEMFPLTRGADYGWPYCYYDVDLKKKVLAPEYGGNGRRQGRCANVRQPAVAFPGHWAPNGLAFYSGTQFPAEYRGGAFVAFHGSWNRAPLPQAGFNVAFVPFRNGRPSGEWRIFANGFRGGENEMRHRPTGLAVATDGSLVVTDDRAGRIYRIRWQGE